MELGQFLLKITSFYIFLQFLQFFVILYFKFCFGFYWFHFLLKSWNETRRYFIVKISSYILQFLPKIIVYDCTYKFLNNRVVQVKLEERSLFYCKIKLSETLSEIIYTQILSCMMICMFKYSDYYSIHFWPRIVCFDLTHSHIISSVPHV